MTVKDLKKHLEKLDDDKIIIITYGIGWSNIDGVKDGEVNVEIIQETETYFF